MRFKVIKLLGREIGVPKKGRWESDEFQARHGEKRFKIGNVDFTERVPVSSKGTKEDNTSRLSENHIGKGEVCEESWLRCSRRGEGHELSP